MRRRCQAVIRMSVLAIAGLLLGACGQQGPLYLPVPPASETTSDAGSNERSAEEDARQRRTADER